VRIAGLRTLAAGSARQDNHIRPDPVDDCDRQIEHVLDRRC
jgi:hypothetical protein